MKLYPIETGNLKLDGGAMFGVVPKSLWNSIYPADENNLCNWSMRCLLAITDEKVILIDNGIGNKQSQKFLNHYYLNGDETMEKSLAVLGYSTDDVTDVIITHLHFDHCGGSIKYNEDKTALIPTFKNATYHTSRQQWEWGTNPNRREKASFLEENILPILESGKLNLFDSNHELFPGLVVKLFNGHTEGQVIPHISYKDKTVVFMADLLPSIAHIPLPYIMSYDTRPLITLEEKENFLNEAAENNYILFLEHDLYNECCTVQKTEKGVKLEKVFKLKDL